MTYATGLEFSKENSGAVLFLTWDSNVAECGSFALKPLQLLQYFALLKWQHVVHVFGAEKSSDHHGTVHLCFWQIQKCKWGHISTCTTCFLLLCSFPFNLILLSFLVILSYDNRGCPLHLNSFHVTSFPPFCNLDTCPVSTLVDTFPSPESR